MPADETITRLRGRHFPSLLRPTEGARDPRPTKKCRVCYARGKRTNKGGPLKTVYVCYDCPSVPGLHRTECFQAYHTLIDFGKQE